MPQINEQESIGIATIINQKREKSKSMPKNYMVYIIRNRMEHCSYIFMRVLKGMTELLHTLKVFILL